VADDGGMTTSRIALAAPPALLTPSDAAWPDGLSDLPDARSLRVAGTIPPLDRAVAIVGTRFADSDALAFTHRLAQALAAHGVTIVSGGASGIDAAAHEGALAVNSPTVAVLAFSLAHAYPKSHGRLFSEIAQSGALVCEVPDMRSPFPGAFLRRNRLIAALVQAVVVVQAPARSGALSTAAWANRLKRKVFVVPSAPWDARGEGCLGLLRQGAGICTSAADVLSLPPLSAQQALWPLPTPAGESNDDAGLPDHSRRVLHALQAGRQHPDDLALLLDVPMAALQEALLTLVLAGLVWQDSDGTYVTAPD
jgi:DNA processing protein